MTIAADSMRLSYTGADTDDTFSYTYEIQNEDDIQVIVRVTSSGAETTLTKTTHYTVTGVSNPNGGTIVLVNGGFDWQDADGDLAAGYKLILLRVPAFTQTTDIKNESEFYATTHERAFDRAVARDQFLKDLALRGIHLPAGESYATYPMELPAAPSRAGGALGFDADGNLSVSNDFDGSANPTVTSVTITGLTASRLVATDASKVLASVSDLSTWIAGTSNQITVTPASGAVTLSISSTLVLPGTMAFSSTIAGTGSHADTSGTKNMVSLAPTFAPASGTADFYALSLTPTFNRTGGSGRASALHINGTVTAAFTGNQAAISIGTAASGSATGATGGLWLYAADNGTTTWEAMRAYWHSGNSSYYISSDHQNSTARKITLAIGGASGSRYEYTGTYFGPTSSQDLTLNCGDSGNRWAIVYGGQHSAGAGLASGVSYGFNGSLTQGFYHRDALRGIVAVVNGVGVATFCNVDADGMFVGYQNIIGFLNSDADAGTTMAAGFGMAAADHIWQVRSTNPQTFSVANTSDANIGATNYELGQLKWSSDVFRVGTMKAGSGTARAMSFVTDATVRLTLEANGSALTFADTVNIAFNTTTGTKIGTATGQKIGFWNADPVIQQAHIADPSGGGVQDAESRTAIAAINAVLAATGLTASS